MNLNYVIFTTNIVKYFDLSFFFLSLYPLLFLSERFHAALNGKKTIPWATSHSQIVYLYGMKIRSRPNLRFVWRQTMK